MKHNKLMDGQKDDQSCFSEVTTEMDANKIGTQSFQTHWAHKPIIGAATQSADSPQVVEQGGSLYHYLKQIQLGYVLNW